MSHRQQQKNNNCNNGINDVLGEAWGGRRGEGGGVFAGVLKVGRKRAQEKGASSQHSSTHKYICVLIGQQSDRHGYGRQTDVSQHPHRCDKHKHDNLKGSRR